MSDFIDDFYATKKKKNTSTINNTDNTTQGDFIDQFYTSQNKSKPIDYNSLDFKPVSVHKSVVELEKIAENPEGRKSISEADWQRLYFNKSKAADWLNLTPEGRTLIEKFKEQEYKADLPNHPIKQALEPARLFNNRMGEASNATTFMDDDLVKTSTGNKTADNISELIGGVLGFVNPMGGGGLFNAGEKVAAKGLVKAIPQLEKVSPKVTKVLENQFVQAGLKTGTGGATFGAGKGVVEGKDVSGIAKEALSEGALMAGMGVAGKTVGLGLSKLASKFKEGKLAKIEIPEEVNSTNPVQNLMGKLKLKNTALDDAINNYNQSIESIQNHFGTNQLRVDEMPRIKSELGIDLDSLVKNIELAEQKGTNIKDLAERRRLSEVVGLTEKPNLTLQKPMFPEVKNLVNGENADTFRSKVNRDIKEKTSTFGENFNKIRTQFVDSAVPFEVLEKNVRGKVASAEDSLYKQARLFKGSPEKAHEIIRTELEPIINNVEKLGYSYKDLGDYALAVHARDVNAKGIKSGFTDAEINSVISKFGTPEMENARQQLVNFNSRLIDDLADAGRISVDDVRIMKEKWPNYMSLFRSFDDEKIEFGKGLSESFANVANPIKKLIGSDRNVIDPIESMIKNTFKITNTADRTRVGSQLLKLADEDVNNQFIRRLAEGEEVGRKNVLTLHENGKKVQVEVQPDVYKAMLNMDKESANLLITILSKPASTLRAGATLTPEFSVRNPGRDVLNAYVVSKSGFNPVTDFSVGLIESIFKGRKINILGKEIQTPGKLYEQFLKDNAGYGNIVSMDRELHRKTLENIIKQPTSKQFLNVINPKSWLNVLRAISDTTETATKLGEYRAALRSGASRQEAAYQARDLMDFARVGTSVKQTNRIVAFLNANIQGKSKLIRAIQENPVGVTTRAIKAITLPTIGVYIAQKTLANDIQRQNIEDAPDWLRDTFWLIPIPGTNQVARIPKPFDLAIFSNPIERVLDYVVENDPEAFDGFIKRTISENSMPVMISGLTPIIEGMANYSFFRQSSVVPQREQGLKYEDQYDIDTTESAKFLAKGMEKLTGGEGSFKNFSSPRVMDNLIQGLTAGLGKYATSAIDTILEGTGVVEKPEKPDTPLSQKPLLRAFLVNESGSGKSMDKLYQEKETLTKEKGSAKLNKEKFLDILRLKKVESVTERISIINKKIRQIEKDSKMSSEAKAEQIKKLNAERNKIARDNVK